MSIPFRALILSVLIGASCSGKDDDNETGDGGGNECISDADAACAACASAKCENELDTLCGPDLITCSAGACSEYYDCAQRCETENSCGCDACGDCSDDACAGECFAACLESYTNECDSAIQTYFTCIQENCQDECLSSDSGSE